MGMWWLGVSLGTMPFSSASHRMLFRSGKFWKMSMPSLVKCPVVHPLSSDPCGGKSEMSYTWRNVTPDHQHSMIHWHFPFISLFVTFCLSVKKHFFFLWAQSLTASKASSCPSGLSEGTRWMRIPSTSCWALGFLSLYSLHRYCMRSRIISRPTASFPWRPAVKRNSGSPAEKTRQDCSYLSPYCNQLTSTWCLLRFTRIIGGAFETQQSSGFDRTNFRLLGHWRNNYWFWISLEWKRPFIIWYWLWNILHDMLCIKHFYLQISWSYEHIPTYFVLCRVARDDHGHYFPSLRAAAQAVDAGDVGTLVVHRLHKLNTWDEGDSQCWQYRLSLYLHIISEIADDY